MDLFKGLLFLEGHVEAINPTDFAEHFGSAVAAQKMFAERWASIGEPRVSESVELPVGCG